MASLGLFVIMSLLFSVVGVILFSSWGLSFVCLVYPTICLKVWLLTKKKQEKLTQIRNKLTLDFPALALATRDGTSNLSPGPKMPLGLRLHVRSPFVPFALRIKASPQL